MRKFKYCEKCEIQAAIDAADFYLQLIQARLKKKISITTTPTETIYQVRIKK